MTGETETIDRLDTLGKNRAYPKGGTCKICGFSSERANFRFSDVCGSHDCRVKAGVCDCRACTEKKKQNVCECEDFKKACESGSTQGCPEDTEESEPAIEFGCIGNINTPIKFCPWCGKRVVSSD